jgi:hypothetical protein
MVLPSKLSVPEQPTLLLPEQLLLANMAVAKF